MTFKTMAEHQRIYDTIWSQMPERQNRHSSSWWFFVLCPKGEKGYGPRQMMFAIASRVGETIRVNDVWLPGIDLERDIVNGVDLFDAMAVSWFCDGQETHDDIVKQATLAELSGDGYIKAWAATEGGEYHGGEIRAASSHPLALAAHFKGARGEARFETWGDLRSVSTSPLLALDIDTPLGGTHYVAWRHLHFKGEFTWPGGSETLEGIGYFQRVCLNIPTFPWKWVWALFADGTLFSAYVPYAGPQLLRKGYRFLPGWLERQALPLLSNGIIDWIDSPGPDVTRFEHASIVPQLNGGPHPNFAVRTEAKNGDFVQFQAVPYGHTRFFIDRPVLGNMLETHWSYNEYMFRMAGLSGRVDGREISEATLGPGYGSLEYAWGLGL